METHRRAGLYLRVAASTEAGSHPALARTSVSLDVADWRERSGPFVYPAIAWEEAARTAISARIAAAVAARVREATPDEQKAALYLVASAYTKAGSVPTLSAQESALRAYCERMGLRVAATYTDVDEHPACNRPLWAAILSDAASARFDTLVIVSVDRLARHLEGVIAAMESLNRCGAGLASVAEGLQPSANPRIAEAVGTVRKMQSSLHSIRVKMGLWRASRQGR